MPVPLIPNIAVFQRKLAGFPLAPYQAGETVLAAGSTTGQLLILREGAVEVLKEGVQIAKVTEPGAVFGESRAVPRSAVHAAMTGRKIIMSNTLGDEAQMFQRMAAADRIRAAKEKTERVVDHLLYLLELHENNAIVLYSSTLSSQIPTSYAANAFVVFRQGLHQIEIVRLCALWDRAEADKENIPTIIELIDCDEVIEELAQETLAHWSGDSGAISNPSEDPELRVLEREALRRANENFGHEQAQRARDELRKTITDARAILNSPHLAGIMNLRDKHLAHSLSKTRREQKTGPVAPMKYGDEREILNKSLPIVEALYCWVNGCSFSLEHSRKIDKKNAEALWNRCTFDIVI
jgi:AbiU2